MGLNSCPFHPLLASQEGFSILHSRDWSVAVKVKDSESSKSRNRSWPLNPGKFLHVRDSV